jgi:hypothetical protein
MLNHLQTKFLFDERNVKKSLKMLLKISKILKKDEYKGCPSYFILVNILCKDRSTDICAEVTVTECG